jgi:plasmid stabilization system protein ParE
VSKPLPIRFSGPASQDLEKISDDLELARGSTFAKKYTDGLRQRIRALSTSPKRYRVRRRLGKGRRLMPELPYHIIYQVAADHVLILRIVHGRRKTTHRSIDIGDG